jgi:serine/threonine-protein kinase
MAFASGSQIGKYVLGRKLGQGGYGFVFAAHDAGLDREVALKFLHAEHTSTPEIARRFLQEARSAAKIAHPGIVTVFECGQIAGTNTEADGTAYIAMELLDGESLTDRLARSGRMSAGAVIEIGRQVASALEAAHRAGIVHRDLKPDNIFLIRDPAARTGERVKVLDFGIAKLGHASSAMNTQSIEVFGTPRYMSPEQCNSASSVDYRSDVYTLGCILFELVCGRPPFEGQVGELIAHHVLVPAPSVLSIVPETPPGLAELIGRMLAKEPDARPQTMGVVHETLDACTGPSGLEPTFPPDPVDSTDTLPHERVDTTLSAAAGVSMLTHRRRRNTALYAIGGLLVVLVPLALWLRFHDDGDDTHKPAPAVAAQPQPKPEPPAKPKVTPIESGDAGPVEIARGMGEATKTAVVTKPAPPPPAPVKRAAPPPAKKIEVAKAEPGPRPAR